MAEWEDRVIGYHCDDIESFSKLNLIQKIHLAHLYVTYEHPSATWNDDPLAYCTEEIMGCFDHVTGGNDEFSIRQMHQEVGKIVVNRMLNAVEEMLPWDEVVTDFLDETYHDEAE